jgi:hypothetical protein
MVQVTIGWGGEFKSSETDIIKSFIINNLDFISIFNELMNRKSSIIRFNNSIRYFWGWENGESFHNSVRIFFSDFGDKESSHTRTSTTTEGVGDLETLEAIATFSFLSNNIEYRINKFSTFSIMSLSPIVTSTSLSENKVVRSEELTERSSSNRVHGSRFEIHKNSSWYESTASSFVIVNINSFELKIRVTMISTCWIDTVFIGDDFPEFSTDLVTALTSLDVNKFSHFI